MTWDDFHPNMFHCWELNHGYPAKMYAKYMPQWHYLSYTITTMPWMGLSDFCLTRKWSTMVCSSKFPLNHPYDSSIGLGISVGIPFIAQTWGSHRKVPQLAVETPAPKLLCSPWLLNRGMMIRKWLFSSGETTNAKPWLTANISGFANDCMSFARLAHYHDIKTAVCGSHFLPLRVDTSKIDGVSCLDDSKVGRTIT